MNKSFDRCSSIVYLVTGAAFMLLSQNISTSAYGSEVGPNIFPFGLGLILVLLSLRLLYETFRYPDAAKVKKSLDYKKFGILFVSAVLYAYFLEDLGYVIGTFLFLLIGFQTLEKGKWLISIAVSALLSIGIYYVFVEILQGSLPGFPVWLGWE
ncbi:MULTISPECIES: tripartite tricarboxylate transporter TctB family protein [Paenibacillus]|uniref:Transporter n=1 Tax=Paenibacillus naphthalenovorans TaxID=162209 RepID=A0A0U2M1R6_9BACL|nr:MULTISPECIES: tripartite tricarboxylate transporter TctB family protein [Paenibacillus]ALS21072.1 transporter [Paenibacillus naphthalenovorans]NTZ18703.1 tripartite tricarboxylate transporter TctB family protein [Paenibacillus sp. JMULE4]GCL71108.1 tripartite tricarboxylate transporter TctB family protein [Paenibacillus naphthalenovorans]SDI63349.1 putative tricarboxylic transport membrane protein [Paenibacillus naphthalenovorans]